MAGDRDRQTKQSIEEAAQAVLDARAKYPGSSLADLYDPLTMPPELVKAHHKLDAAVDAAYSKKKFSGDSDRVAFLFELYQQLASPLEAKETHTARCICLTNEGFLTIVRIILPEDGVYPVVMFGVVRRQLKRDERGNAPSV